MLQDVPFRMPALVVVEVPSNLPIPFVLEPMSSIPLWNKKVENYVYFVFRFANKYLYSSNVMVYFHDNDLLIFKEIKSFLENSGYEIHSRWAVINTLPRMNLDTKGRKVMFCPHSCLDQSIFQNPLYSLIFNFCNAYLFQLGNSYCLSCQRFQVLGPSCKHGEAGCFVNEG